MADKDLTGLLNLSYEIEGLLMLHINRGDEASPEMKNLLIKKAEMLLAGIKGEECDSASVSKPVEAVICEEAVDDATEIAESAVESELEEADEPEKVDETEEVDEPVNITPTINDSLLSSSPLTLDQKISRDSATDISKAFTLNDRFRFRRELFRNSDGEFMETIEVLGAMSSMEEAEDYFFNDLCWDSENPVVKEFMAIVAKHF